MHEPSLFPATDDARVTEDTQMMRDVDHRNGQSLCEFRDAALSSLQFADNPQPFRCCKSREHAGTTGGLQWVGSHGSCQTFNQTLVNQMGRLYQRDFFSGGRTISGADWLGSWVTRIRGDAGPTRAMAPPSLSTPGGSKGVFREAGQMTVTA